MITTWYLVKRNWPQTQARCPGYAGLGGNVWPLDEAIDRDSKEVHSRMVRSREHINFGDHEELLCTNRSVAESYFKATADRFDDAWLLQLAVPSGDLTSTAGLDLGFPSGGFSTIETELLTQGLPGPQLNECGLIDTLATTLEYFDARKGNDRLEQLDGLLIVSVRTIIRPVTMSHLALHESDHKHA